MYVVSEEEVDRVGELLARLTKTVDDWELKHPDRRTTISALSLLLSRLTRTTELVDGIQIYHRLCEEFVRRRFADSSRQAHGAQSGE